MIMRAKNEGNVLILELEGHLDFETTQQFQETCTSLIRKQEATGVIFDMEKLKFVGSSGINHFVKVLKEFNSGDMRPKFCHVSSEFSKIFRAYQTARNPFEIFDDKGQAIAAVANPPPVKKVSPRRKKEIEN
jgi:anti-anti-sigma factor